MISVVDGTVSLVPTTFEWAEEIDAERAQRSAQRAQAVLDNKTAADTDVVLAKARLRRALVRKSVATDK
jgi:F-type H+-transporting ATPase subunit epsilon